jgi:hypothetical protein
MIRRAGLVDIEPIGILLATYEPLFADQRPAPDAIKRMLERVVSQGALLVAETPEGHPLGGLGLVPFEWPYSGRTVLVDAFLYATPGAGRAAEDLVRFAIAIATAARLPLLLGQTSGQRVSTVDRWMTRLGGTRVGGVFRFETL